MLKIERVRQIEDYIYSNGTVSLDELVDVFQVSKNTIRRDVQELVESGKFNKVYGGVNANRPSLEPFTDREARNRKEKRLIAEQAAKFIENDEIIFIDSGTTTLEMIDFINTLNLTIITNNIEFIYKALPYDNLNVISTGGILERKTKSFININNKKDLLNERNIDKAFMATTGISATNGVTNSSPLETEIKQTVVQRSPEVYLLIDHGKFNKNGVMTYCNLDEIDYLITDRMPSEKFQLYVEENGIQLITADN